MFKKLFYTILVLFPLYISSFGFSWAKFGDQNSIYFLTTCKALLTKESFSKTSQFDQGICLSAIQTLSHVQDFINERARFCAPEGVSYLQSLAVIIRYMEMNPELLNISYGIISQIALREAWPCPKPNP